MKVLVTGSAGFIGSHLCERLIAEGHEVIGVDDLSTGTYENLSAVIGHPSFHFFKKDISRYGIVTHHFNEIDWVFHLAAKADVVPSIEAPLLNHRVNVTGTVKALEAAKILKAKRFIYVASSSCYGIPDFYPTPETAPMRPMYPYALTKYLGEQYVMHWAQVYGLPAISLRLFNVYGPRSRARGSYGAMFGVFLSQLANGAPLTVVGDGNQARDFTYVTDVVDALIKAAESNVSGECINIGTGICQSVNYVVSLLGAPQKVHIEDRPGEPRKTQADTEKAEKLLGWKPYVPFVNGVDNMVKIVDKYKDAPLWTPESIEVATKSWFQHMGEK